MRFADKTVTTEPQCSSRCPPPLHSTPLHPIPFLSVRPYGPSAVYPGIPYGLSLLQYGPIGKQRHHISDEHCQQPMQASRTTWFPIWAISNGSIPCEDMVFFWPLIDFLVRLCSDEHSVVPLVPCGATPDLAGTRVLSRVPRCQYKVGRH